MGLQLHVYLPVLPMGFSMKDVVKLVYPTTGLQHVIHILKHKTAQNQSVKHGGKCYSHS